MLARNAGFCLLLLLPGEVYSCFGRVDNRRRLPAGLPALPHIAAGGVSIDWVLRGMVRRIIVAMVAPDYRLYPA